MAPAALQLEVTNRCNLNCVMCIRRYWRAEPADMELSLFKKIAREGFSELSRLDLYGFGEPLINPRFLDMVRVAREYLPKDSELMFSTNGTLLSPSIADKVVGEKGATEVFFSIDAYDANTLKEIRAGVDADVVFRNLLSLAKHPKHASGELRLGVEAVAMADNFQDLPQLIKAVGEWGVEKVMVTHVAPFSKEVFEKAVYLTISQAAYELMKPFAEEGWEFVKNICYEAYGEHFLGFERRARKRHEEMWNEALKRGYWINLPLFLESLHKLPLFEEVEKAFSEAERIAREYGVELELPSPFPDARSRSCPYVEKEAAFVRCDGMVSPCAEFAYAHPLWVNAHHKEVYEVFFGDLRTSSLEEVWDSPAYASFRELRKRFSQNIPWCGDCVYSSLDCWYVRNNLRDCMLNEPSCSECLYSVDLARCNI